MKNKLALVRFLVPGCLLYVLLVAVCAATNWCSLALPTNWEELSKLTLAVALAFLYNSVRLRERMNESFFKAVNQNLVDKLTAPFAANPMVPRPLQWRHVRRGYPPPTQFFRWCTKDLRIRPVQSYIKHLGENALVVVGTRAGESAQRDRTLGEASERIRPFIRPQTDGGFRTQLYSPIIDFDLSDVWEALTEIKFPASIDVDELVSIYRGGRGECPTIRETNDKPCASARFGCWTCTVVRRDRSAENMIEAGYEFLRPYHEFRNWLLEMRNNPTMRCKLRRSGASGLGPFTLDARMMMLKKVSELEIEVGAELISEEERGEIERLWNADKNSMRYRALEYAGYY